MNDFGGTNASYRPGQPSEEQWNTTHTSVFYSLCSMYNNITPRRRSTRLLTPVDRCCNLTMFSTSADLWIFDPLALHSAKSNYFSKAHNSRLNAAEGAHYPIATISTEYNVITSLLKYTVYSNSAFYWQCKWRRNQDLVLLKLPEVGYERTWILATKGNMP